MSELPEYLKKHAYVAQSKISDKSDQEISKRSVIPVTSLSKHNPTDPAAGYILSLRLNP